MISYSLRAHLYYNKTIDKNQTQQCLNPTMVGGGGVNVSPIKHSQIVKK